MEYNNQSHVTNLAEVVYFFEHLIYERKLSFHPDDDFVDYESSDSGKPMFDANEVAIYNRLMNESFNVCNKENFDIYSIGNASMRRALVPSIIDPICENELVRINGNNAIYKVISIDDDQRYHLQSISDGSRAISVRANLKGI